MREYASKRDGLRLFDLSGEAARVFAVVGVVAVEGATDALVYAEAAAALPFGEDAPAWLDGWELVRQDKAGMVHFHLLQLHKSQE